MPSPPIGCRELDMLVHEVLRVHNEHARATSESVRRKLHARLLDLEERFERALTESVPDEAVRRAWREHLRGHGPAPAEPRPPPNIVFRGRSEAGSDVVVHVASNGELRVDVDGGILDHGGALNLRQDGERAFFEIAGVGDFGETFVASPEAIEALRVWIDEPRGKPPWEHLRELADDGLIGKDFALTPRGRRALGRAAA